MEENQVNNPEIIVPKKKKSRKLLWIIVGAVLVVAAVVIIVLTNQARNAAAQSYQTQTITKNQLVAIVGATGTVRANQTTDLTWQTSGRIEKINFKVGDLVTSGETLATLAETSLPQSVILASSDLINALQSLNDLNDSTVNLSNAELSLAQAKRDYNTALGNYWDRNQSQGSANLITITEAKLQILDNNIIDLQKAYDNMAELQANDSKKAQALANLTQAHIDRDNMKRLLDYYKANPDTLDLDILQGKLDVAKANLDTAQRTYDQVKTPGSTPMTWRQPKRRWQPCRQQ